MSMNFITKLPIPQETKERYPVSDAAAAAKVARDEEIRRVFTGESQKRLLIIGPCSADSEEPVLEYVRRLRLLQDQVAIIITVGRTASILTLPIGRLETSLVTREVRRGFRHSRNSTSFSRLPRST